MVNLILRRLEFTIPGMMCDCVCDLNYFILQILAVDAVVPAFRRHLPVDLRPQERRLDLDRRFLAGSRRVPGVTRESQTVSERAMKLSLKR